MPEELTIPIKQARERGGDGTVGAFAAGEHGAGAAGRGGHDGAAQNIAEVARAVGTEHALRGDPADGTHRTRRKPLQEIPALGGGDGATDDAVDGGFYGGETGNAQRLRALKRGTDKTPHAHLRERERGRLQGFTDRAAADGRYRPFDGRR